MSYFVYFFSLTIKTLIKKLNLVSIWLIFKLVRSETFECDRHGKLKITGRGPTVFDTTVCQTENGKAQLHWHQDQILVYDRIKL